MNAPQLSEMIESSLKLANESYATGLEQGYARGYQAGHKTAIETALGLIDKTFPKKTEEQPA